MPAAAPKRSPRWRIGAVSYLNTKPLVYRLAERLPDAQLILDVPSRLADRLADGALDVALIPSVEFFQNAGYRIVSDACIGCRGPVLSVKLLTRKPWPEIRRVGLDEGSRTSVALTRILLEKRYGLQPDWVDLPLGQSVSQCDADAVLLIGDRAIHPPSEGFVDAWDLGAQWCQWAQLPFVFAMWTAREGAELGPLPAALSAARDCGVANLNEIAAAEAGQVGLSPDDCLRYLRDNLYFYLGPQEQAGLTLFYNESARLKLAPARLDLTRVFPAPNDQPPDPGLPHTQFCAAEDSSL